MSIHPTHSTSRSRLNLHLSPLQNLTSLRFTPGVVLRGAADVGSIWLAMLLSSLLVAGPDFVASPGRSAGTIVLLLGSCSLVAFIAYAGAGLYSHGRPCTLVTKIWLVSCINFFLLMTAGAILLLVGRLTQLSADILLTAFFGATLLSCLVRAISEALRSDYRSEIVRAHHAQADERKILVIGGAGYVGSALVERLLNEDMQVLVLDAMHFGEDPLSRVARHPNLTLIREDFRHIEVLTRAMSGIGSVVHLGGLVGDPACALYPELTVDVNVTATRLVGEIAKAQGVRRFIFASSCSVYGSCDEIVDENSRVNPQSLYARSKVASEIVLGALNSADFAVTCLRFATIYGISGRTRFDLVVNLLCAKAVREDVITVFGPDQWRPFVHVDDVARAVVLALQAPIESVAGEALNVGSNVQNYTLAEAARLINRQVPDAQIVCDATSVDTRNYRVCFDRIRTRLGFEPAWTLERGIAQVVALVRSNEVGHYSLPAYSNVLCLKDRGTRDFSCFKITGWESELMNVDRITSASRQAAA